MLSVAPRATMQCTVLCCLPHVPTVSGAHALPVTREKRLQVKWRTQNSKPHVAFERIYVHQLIKASVLQVL